MLKFFSFFILIFLNRALAISFDGSCGSLIEKVFIIERAHINLPANSSIENISALSERVTKKDLQVIADVIRDINKGILSHTKVVHQVQKLSVQVAKTDNNAYFMGFHQQILYSVRQMKMPAKEKNGQVKFYVEHPMITRPVTAHEFGHGIVNRTMLENMPEYEHYIDTISVVVEDQIKLEAMATKGQALEKEAREIIANKFPHMSFENIDIELVKAQDPYLFSLLQKYSKLLQEFLKKRDELNQLNQLAQMEAGPWQLVNKIFAAHNEFFADVVAIMHSESKPDAVSDALDSVRHYQLDNDHSEKRALHRHFDYRHNRLDKWQEDPEVHNRFAPTRFHVFQKYLKQPTHTRPKIQAQILDNIMRAIIKDVRTRIDLGGVHRFPKEDNRVLMDLIDEMFEKHPIDYSVIDSPMF